MKGIPADKIVGYTLDGYILCDDCIDSKNMEERSPIFITDELEDGSHCDSCLYPINELAIN